MTELTPDEIKHLYKITCDLPLCGCGNPETAYDLVHELLKLAPFYERSYDELTALIGTPGAYHFVLGALDHADLIEHGGSIGGSWLTSKGEWFLAVLDDLGPDADLPDLLREVGMPHAAGVACTERCWSTRH